MLILVLAAGHQLRVHLLLGPEGAWRQELQHLPWSDEGGDMADVPAVPKAVLSLPLAINTAPLDSLVLLPGVGPVLAARIRDARNSGHIFRKASDLKVVKGIGARLAARLDTLLAYGSASAK